MWKRSSIKCLQSPYVGGFFVDDVICGGHPLVPVHILFHFLAIKVESGPSDLRVLGDIRGAGWHPPSLEYITHGFPLDGAEIHIWQQSQVKTNGTSFSCFLEYNSRRRMPAYIFNSYFVWKSQVELLFNGSNVTNGKFVFI